MAIYEAVKTLSLPAGEDLNGDLYEVLAVSRAAGRLGKLVKADANAANVNERYPVAILAENPGTTVVDDMVTVIPISAGGIAKVKASAAITAGQIIVASNTPGVVAGVDDVGDLGQDQRGIGIALEAASAAGEIISILLDPVAVPHSA